MSKKPSEKHARNAGRNAANSETKSASEKKRDLSASKKPSASSSAREAASSAPRMSTHGPSLPAFGPPPRWVLPFLIGVYVVLTLLLIARVPLGRAPDEMPHMLYVQTLAQTGQLPVFDPSGGNTNPGYEFHQPPLYYALCAPLWRLAGAGAQNYACRVVSLLCGAATLWFLWNAVATLFPRRGELWVLATAFAALLPAHQAVGAVASNDALAGLLCALVFHRVARMSTHAASMRDAVALGVLVGLGMLAKSTCLVMGLVAFGALWRAARRLENQQQSEAEIETKQTEANATVGDSESRARSSGVSPLALCGVMSVVSLLICGWWLARNRALYGDVFALGVFNQAFGQARSAQVAQAVGVGLLPLWQYARAELVLLFLTFWGFFGGPESARDMVNPFTLHARPGAFAFLIPALLASAASVAATIGLWRARGSWKTQSEAVRDALALWMAGLLLVSLAWLQFNTHYYQAQARYFHPALLPIALGFALGWRRAFGVSRFLFASSALFALTLLGLSLWNIFVWHTLL